MVSCEKCWKDSGSNVDKYEQLLAQRNAAGQECTAEQQAGKEAGYCSYCGKRTIHMHAGVCMQKDCERYLREAQ